VKHRYVGGIDADIDACGFAIWDRQESRWVDISKLAIEGFYEKLFHVDKSNVVFYVEAGWKNEKANFRRGRKSAVSETIAMHVGMNHAASKIAARILKKMGFEVLEVAPLRKGFMKNNNGWTPAGREHFYKLTGIGKKISDDEKDAALLAYTFR
jgi:hypothetical protein